MILVGGRKREVFRCHGGKENRSRRRNGERLILEVKVQRMLGRQRFNRGAGAGAGVGGRALVSGEL